MRCLINLLLTAIAVLAVLPVDARAHEGHAPLPSKGIQVDAAKGTLLLTQSARDALGLQTSEVALQKLELQWLAYARLQAPWSNSAVVASQLPGRIAKIHRLPGEWIEAGEPLAEIESAELEALQADLVQASLASQLSLKLLEQFQALSGQSISAGQLQQAQSDHLTNLNRLAIARWKLVSLGFDQQWLAELTSDQSSSPRLQLTLRSPISGRVHHNDLTVGKVILPGEHLFEVDLLADIWCRIEVLERDLNELAIGQSVEIQLNALPHQTFRTSLARIDPWIDAGQQLGLAWADLKNVDPRHPQLLPGMFGQATIRQFSDTELLTVPPSAVARDGAERFVLVQQEATKKASQFIKRNIEVVRETPTAIQFRSAEVFPGDLVVTTGAQQLFNFFVQSVLQLSAEARANIALKLEPASLRAIETTVKATGRVELPPDQRAFTSIQINGILQTLNCQRGQAVEVGDLLGTVNSLEFQDLQLQLLHWKLVAENWRTTRDRLEAAGENNPVARRQLWETETHWQQAERQFDSLQRKLLSLGLTTEELSSLLKTQEPLSALPLRSPITGQLVRFHKRLGETIQAGENLFEIHDPRNGLIRALVPEIDSQKLQAGQSVRIRLVSDEQQIYQGQVVRIGQTIQPDNRTLAIWLLPSDDAKQVWIHDMLANVDIVTHQSTPVLTIPLTAVVTEGSRQYVFVLMPDDRFERRLLQLGSADDQFVEVRSGLAPDEQVAAWGVTGLQTAYNSLR